MPEPVETLPVLEQRLTAALLAFERLDEAWPRGQGAVERAEIGRQRSVALLDVETLQQCIMRARAATLADAAVQLRRLVVLADVEPRPHALLSSPDVRGPVASAPAEGTPRTQPYAVQRSRAETPQPITATTRSRRRAGTRLVLRRNGGVNAPPH